MPIQKGDRLPENLQLSEVNTSPIPAEDLLPKLPALPVEEAKTTPALSVRPLSDWFLLLYVFGVVILFFNLVAQVIRTMRVVLRK